MNEMFVSRSSALSLIAEERRLRHDGRQAASGSVSDDDLVRLLLDVRAGRIEAFRLRADLTIRIMT
ncbi:hypothetical protein [Paraburkholderia phosphatilytica]|uniref:hypothetical protein n=1 Tax=Paraburkholderia phosphatilytica TaxID=2282883 RepID=UPI000F5F9DA7|nr:hypothetical protein [Paraburkholderia phosphatilytica]